jgi:Fe2+ or Zn2+ uptake regulation protein
MSAILQKSEPISLTEQESVILDIVKIYGHCNSSDVKAALPGNHELLLVMRTMHRMVESGLLKRVVVNGKSVYRLNTYYLRRKVNHIRLK